MSLTGSCRVLAVVPARYASTRFPGKVLAPLAGRPLVYHTYSRTCEARHVSQVIVATDDDRVRDALVPLNVPVVMTRQDHASGTDRIAEVASRHDAEIVVNVQGDEPLIDPHTVDEVVHALRNQPDIPMATARRRITDAQEISDPNVVKVVCDSRGRALYFSRYPIPYVRDAADSLSSLTCHWQHIGIYAYRRGFLLEFASWPPSNLERLEKLEQLRVLERGRPIAVVDTTYRSIGVDTPEDLERVRALLEGALEGKT
jgi:3-deoxy-manno-octulosonate cytidylyltransferase (CMP-KDO synthetase)